MDVNELRHLAELNSIATKRIYNPDTDDFTVNYHGQPFVIRALEIQEYPLDVANHIQKHLADKLLWKRGIKINPQEDLSNIFKEIEVTL